MCMDKSVRIESKDVPKYAYKVYYDGAMKNTLRTYFKLKNHKINKFNKSEVHKKTIKHLPFFVQNDLLHFGRISVFVNKEDAFWFCRNRRVNSYKPESINVWKVEIKQTTKYAYQGLFSGQVTLAVDKVKPIEQVV